MYEFPFEQYHIHYVIFYFIINMNVCSFCYPIHENVMLAKQLFLYTISVTHKTNMGYFQDVYSDIRGCYYL